MQFNLKKNRRRPLHEINVVPYIDIMLVLLIIFIITAPLINQGVSVTLPQAQAQALPSQQAPPIIVSIDQAGNYYLNIASNPQQAIDPDSLKQQVTQKILTEKQQNTPPIVLVKGDAQAHYEAIVKAMVTLQQAGAENIGLITQPDTSLSTGP